MSGHFTSNEIDSMLEAALECLLWSEYDWAHDNETPLDELFEVSDFSEEAVAQLREELTDFVESNVGDIELMISAGFDFGQIGHDFILTRNGHGAGFWDRGLGENGERLTEMVKPFGEVRAYSDNDNKLHLQ
jgi:hypothetical protein